MYTIKLSPDKFVVLVCMKKGVARGGLKVIFPGKKINSAVQKNFNLDKLLKLIIGKTWE